MADRRTIQGVKLVVMALVLLTLTVAMGDSAVEWLVGMGGAAAFIVLAIITLYRKPS